MPICLVLILTPYSNFSLNTFWPVFCYKRQPDRCSHRGEAFCIVSLIAVNVLGCFLACGLAQLDVQASGATK